MGKMQNETRKKNKVQNASKMARGQKTAERKQNKTKQSKKKFASYHTSGGLREISRVALNISHLTVRFGNLQFYAKFNWHSDHARIT